MKRIITACSSLFFIILVIIFFGGLWAYHTYTQGVSEKHTIDSAYQLHISQGESIQQVSSELLDKHIITNEFLFSLYLKLNHKDTSLKAGTYIIPTKSSIVSLTKLFDSGLDTFTFTITEGKRIEEEADILQTDFANLHEPILFNKDDFTSLAKSAQQFNTYPFISPKVQTLEGFLYPDTYIVSKEATANEIIHLMLDTFKTKVYTQYSQDIYNHIIISSLLEREAKTDTDKRMITDIINRRIAIGMPLGIDASIQYFLGYSKTEQTWWRQTLYQSDLDNPNIYNTRVNAGLTPGPICSSSIATIIDSYTPIANNYLFYISDSSGVIHYARTSTEQEINIGRYL